MRVIALVVLGVLLPALSVAQSEVALQEFFEGSSVLAKIDMPAAVDGVDVYPGEAPAVDSPEQIEMLQSWGVGVCKGQPVQITKVRVKDQHIEFQLAGGGRRTTQNAPYQRMNVTGPAPAYWRGTRSNPDTSRMDNVTFVGLEGHQNSLKARWRKVRLVYASGDGAECVPRPGGSRFNIRQRADLPDEGLTPEAVMSALELYLEFGDSVPDGAAHADADTGDMTEIAIPR